MLPHWATLRHWCHQGPSFTVHDDGTNNRLPWLPFSRLVQVAGPDNMAEVLGARPGAAEAALRRHVSIASGATSAVGAPLILESLAFVAVTAKNPAFANQGRCGRRPVASFTRWR